MKRVNPLASGLLLRHHHHLPTGMHRACRAAGATRIHHWPYPAMEAGPPGELQEDVNDVPEPVGASVLLQKGVGRRREGYRR